MGQIPVHVSVAPRGAGVMVHIHPGAPGKHREMDQGGHWHMMLSVTLLGGGIGHIYSRGWGLQELIIQDPKALTSAMTYTVLMTVALFCLH